MFLCSLGWSIFQCKGLKTHYQFFYINWGHKLCIVSGVLHGSLRVKVSTKLWMLSKRLVLDLPLPQGCARFFFRASSGSHVYDCLKKLIVPPWSITHLMRICSDLNNSFQILSKLLTLHVWEGCRCRQNNVACDSVFVKTAENVSYMNLCATCTHISTSNWCAAWEWEKGTTFM